jgi:predicted nucleotidyltransferase component of viral defense system
MSRTHDALVQSVKARLVRRAHSENLDPYQVLTRFAIERFLYRLSKSPWGERFILKGANLFLVWFGNSIRPTRDADLLGLDDLDAERLEEIFRSVCDQVVEPDGMAFDPDSIEAQLIRRDQPAQGQRATLLGRLGTARLKVQVDVGRGDAVTPAPQWIEFPTLLDHPKPRIQAYRPETAVAEKLHAMVRLGARTSRLRDFFDVRVLAAEKAFDFDALVAAVRATFESRDTRLPSEAPTALTPSFARAPDKQTQWRAFLRRSGLQDIERDFEVVVEDVARFLLPVMNAAHEPESLPGTWPAGGPWHGPKTPQRTLRRTLSG